MSAAPNDPTMKAGGGIDGQVLGLASVADTDSLLGAGNFREVNRPFPTNPPACETFDAKAKARFWRKVSPAPADACWIWWGASNLKSHELTPENTIWIQSTGQRRCRICVADRTKGATA